jgi:hypothetical protein
MPLKKGPHSIGANLKKLLGEGYDRKQALAIALDIARGRKKMPRRKGKR